MQLRHERMSKADDTNLQDRSFMDTMHSSWGRQPSVDELLSNIVKLWNEMHVPLLTRSQFWLTHQGKDVFYYMAEEGHLLDEQRYVVRLHSCGQYCHTSGNCDMHGVLTAWDPWCTR